VYLDECVLENKTEKADKNYGERPVNDDKDLVYLHVGNSDDRVGYRLSQNHTADAAEVVLCVEISPGTLVRTEDYQAAYAADHADNYRNKKLLGEKCVAVSVQTVEQKVGGKRRSSYHKSVCKGKDYFSESELFEYIFH
jgi:hypothetical protein